MPPRHSASKSFLSSFSIFKSLPWVLMPTLRVLVQSAKLTNGAKSNWNKAHYVSLDMFSQTLARTGTRRGQNPQWDEEFRFDLSSVARLDVTLVRRPRIGPEKKIGTYFLDLSGINGSQEIELDAALPRGGSIQLKVCPVDFNPQHVVASGYLPLQGPLSFNTKKSYEVNMKTGQVIDLEVGRPVFSLDSNGRSFRIVDLSRTQLLEMKCSTKLGSFKYKARFGGRAGPLLCSFIEATGDPIAKMTMVIPNSAPNVLHSNIEGNWRRRTCSMSRGQQQVASATRIPGKTLWVHVNPGEDVLLHIACAVAMAKIAKSNRQIELAMLISVTVIVAPLFLVVLI